MIDCHQCEQYYVTWGKHFPHGCRAMKFKSKQIPGLVVLSSSQTDCQLFKEKNSRKGLKLEQGQGDPKPLRILTLTFPSSMSCRKKARQKT